MASELCQINEVQTLNQQDCVVKKASELCQIKMIKYIKNSVKKKASALITSVRPSL